MYTHCYIQDLFAPCNPDLNAMRNKGKNGEAAHVATTAGALYTYCECSWFVVQAEGLGGMS